MTTGWGQLPRETPVEFMCFETYRDLGITRSLRLAAERTGTPLRTVERMSRRNSWVTRARAWDAGLIETAETLHTSDLRRDVTRGLFEQVDCEFRAMLSGREPSRSPAEIAMLLSQASRGLDDAPIAAERVEQDGTFDDCRLAREDLEWLEATMAAIKLPDEEPDVDPRVADIKRRTKEMLQLIDRWLKGDPRSPLTQRDACRLYAEIRQQHKRLAKLCPAARRRETHDFAKLREGDLNRVHELTLRGYGESEEKIRLLCGRLA
jgi:hypothetical protein